MTGLLLMWPVWVSAQQQFVLNRIEKQDEVNVTRFVLEFNRIPDFSVKTSGQRLEVELKNCQARTTLLIPPEDERLVRILVGHSKEKLVLSLLLRRPPYFVNAVKDLQGRRLMIDVHWKDVQSGTRPAIARSLPGELSLQNRGAVGSHGIDSKYRNDWVRFYRDYERPVALPLPLRYTLAPFPVLKLIGAVEDVVPREVEELVALGEWKSALSALKSIGYEAEEGNQFARFLLIVAELHLRNDDYFRAQRMITKAQGLMDEEAEVLRAVADLLQMYVAAGQLRDPYQLMADLQLKTERHDLPALRPFVELFYAEVALATGHFRQARPILEEQLLLGVGSLGNIYQQRLADVEFAQGNVRGALERYHGLREQLRESPMSLASFALSLYRTKDYSGAVEQLKVLSELTENAEQRDLVRYMLAMALIRSGESGPGYDLLHQIIPGTQGAVLAKAKIADLSMEVESFQSRNRAMREYGELIDQMAGRDGRAEMQFKHALARYLLGQRMEAVEELRQLLKADRMTDLVPHAQALLAEILPDLIRGFVEDEKYFNALLLVEQNRELLVASQRDFSFLIDLGDVFSQLEFSDRAIRLYLYLLDYAGTQERTAAVYAPLLKALLKQESYARALEYVERYEKNYPKGSQRAEIYLYKVKALLGQGSDEEAYAALTRKQRPRSAELDRLTAQLAWERGDVALAQQYIAAVVDEKSDGAVAADKMLQAEVFYTLKRDAEALLIYQQLQQDENYQDQAVYREALIRLRQGARSRGLKLLQQLVEKGTGTQWRKLAEETLEIERFDR